MLGTWTVKHFGNPEKNTEKGGQEAEGNPFTFLLIERQLFERRCFVKTRTEKRDKELNPHIQTTKDVKDKDN